MKREIPEAQFDEVVDRVMYETLKLVRRAGGDPDAEDMEAMRDHLESAVATSLSWWADRQVQRASRGRA